MNSNALGRRADPVHRKASILASAIALSLEQDHDYRSLTRKQVAARAQVCPSLITRYFPSMGMLKAAVMRAAIQKDLPAIVAQGLSVGDSIAKKAPKVLKERAALYILNS